MKGDPTTTIETLDDGSFVITHCFFDVHPFGSRTWEVVAEEFEALGCTVEPIWTPIPYDPEHPRLNFCVTLPIGAVRGTGIRYGNVILDVFFVGENYLYILRPDQNRSCRTLAIGEIAKIGNIGVGNFWWSLSPELTALIQAEAA